MWNKNPNQASCFLSLGWVVCGGEMGQAVLFQPMEPSGVGWGGLPFKYEERKQTLLLMRPLGGGLGPTRAAGVLGH